MKTIADELRDARDGKSGTMEKTSEALEKVLNARPSEVPVRGNAKLSRIARYGIRVMCLMCGWEGRHNKVARTQTGGTVRLRERGCDRCGLKRLRPTWWIEKYPAKAHAEAKRIRNTRFLMD